MTGKPVINYEAEQDPQRQAWIYKLSGKLIGSRICYEILDEARGRITADTPHVVLDITGVTMLNSTGIGIIASLYNTAHPLGGKIYLVGADDHIRRPLTATHVWDFLQNCGSLAELPDQL